MFCAQELVNLDRGLAIFVLLFKRRLMVYIRAVSFRGFLDLFRLRLIDLEELGWFFPSNNRSLISSFLGLGHYRRDFIIAFLRVGNSEYFGTVEELHSEVPSFVWELTKRFTFLETPFSVGFSLYGKQM